MRTFYNSWGIGLARSGSRRHEIAVRGALGIVESQIAPLQRFLVENAQGRDVILNRA
jgi:hypothetical protein